MDIITQYISVNKGRLGYTIKGQKTAIKSNQKPPTRSAGDITRFSSKSRNRLRERLAMARTKSPSTPFGFCWTIPGDILTPEETRALWHDWVANHLRRKWDEVAWIWRIELQKRNQAHWHAVGWLPHHSRHYAEIPSHILTILMAWKIADDWFNFVSQRLSKDWDEKTAYGALKRSCKVQPLEHSSATNIVGYLADHTTKHKQEQLGWKGRQWGIVNKGLLTLSPLETYKYPLNTHKAVVRAFRRLQEHLRRDGKYTGAKIATDGSCISQSLFGRDLDRFLTILTHYSDVRTSEGSLITNLNQQAH